jgi:hypothetical protein
MPGAISAKTCAEIELKVAATRSERQAAFELVYQSYLRAGLCAENPLGMRFTPYQLLPTTDIIIAKLRGEVVSTLSLVRDGELGLPMEEIYGEEVAARRNRGVRLAEVSCLADRRKDAARFFGLFREMTRLMAQLGKNTGVDELVVAVHPRHTGIYRRYMAFQPMGDLRNYPAVQERPAVALCLNFDAARIDSPKSWQEFFAVPLPISVLRTCPMPEEDRKYFSSLLTESNYDCPAMENTAALAAV